MYKSISKKISIWLLTCYFFGFIIVILGGATRLTNSGLSITHWGIFKGTIIPITEEEWLYEFSLYKKSLEYKVTYEKSQMTLKEFKSIFWLEYFHRLFARFLGGIIFFVPFFYFFIRFFLWKKILPFKDISKILFAFLLGFLQAIVGWIMVKTGLNKQTAYIFGDKVSVNPVSLVFHLNLAFCLMIYLFHLFLYFHDLSNNSSKKNGLSIAVKFKRYFKILFICLFITISFGGLVAGLKAGLFYQSFPLMHGYVFPPDLFLLSPIELNFYKNQTTVQFFHRLFAIFTALFSIVLWILCYKKQIFQYSKKMKIISSLFLFLLFSQIMFGILTLLYFKMRDLHSILLCLIHQSNALILLTIFYYIYNRLYFSRELKINEKFF